MSQTPAVHPPGDVAVRAIIAAADPALSAVAAIYVGAIPAAERKPAAWLAEAAGRADFAVLVAESAGRAVGFATVFVPADPAAAALLEYLAVDGAARGGGIGTAVFRAVVAHIGGRPLLVEVEAVGPPDAGQVDRVRRQAFYRRLGCRSLVGLHYTLPLPGRQPPMDLMAFGVGPTVPRPVVERWVATVYRDVYDAGDPATVVAGATDPVRAE